MASRDARSLVKQGIDPQQQRKENQQQREHRRLALVQQEQEEGLKGSLEELLELYVEHLKHEEKASYREVERAFKKNVCLILDATRKAKDIKPSDIKLILHKIIERGSLIQANRVRSYLSAAFRFGIEYDNDPKNLQSTVMFYLETNPVRDVPKPQKREQAGERDLSAEEIGVLWQGLDNTKMSFQTTTVLKLILATGGQRVGEILEAKWEEFDIPNATWTIPHHRTKNGRTHVIPLGKTALALLKRLHRSSGDSDYLFPKIKTELSSGPCMPLATLSRALNRFCEQTGFSKFTPRDLRRTCKTRMGAIGLSKEIRDRIHNHALGDVSSKHYDRYDYFKEKKAALDTWDQWLQSIIKPPKSIKERS